MGTYAKITSVGIISSLVNETQRNQLTYKLYSRLRGETDWGDAIKISTLEIGILELDVIDILGEYAADDSFEFRLDIADKFNTSISVLLHSTGVVTMSWSKNGVGIGKIW